MSVFLSVIIPSYNEQENIARGVLDEVLNYLKKQSYEFEIILSDDGSADGTSAALETWAKNNQGVRVLKNVHAGKGPTVQSGMLAATGQWRLFTDFDQSTPLSELEKLLPFTQEGYEVIIGSREITGAVRDDEPWYRHLMGKGFNVFVQLFAIRGIYDTQCGFKLFSATATQAIFSKLVVYGRKTARADAFTGAFDVEALFLAKKMGFKIKEVPITWYHHSTNRVSPVKDSLRMFKDIVRVRLNSWLGRFII